MELEMGYLHLHDTSEKMMNMLRKKSRKIGLDILKLVTIIKFDGLKTHTIRVLETYNKAMNTALIKF